MCLLMPFLSYNQIRNISLLYFSSNNFGKIGLKCLARSLLTKGAAQFNYKIYAYYTIKPITLHPIREKISPPALFAFSKMQPEQNILLSCRYN